MPKDTLVIGTANTIIGSLGLVPKPEPKKEEPKKPADVKPPEGKVTATASGVQDTKKPADASKPPETKAEAKPAEKLAEKKKAGLNKNKTGHSIWT